MVRSDSRGRCGDEIRGRSGWEGGGVKCKDVGGRGDDGMKKACAAPERETHA